MKLIRIFAAALACGWASSVFAQVTPGQYPSGYVQGNATASTAAPRASDARAVLHRALGCTDNQVVSIAGGTIACVSIGTTLQAWDADLDCLAALSGTGLLRRTGAGTCSAGTTVATSEITDDAVTFDKLQNIATDRLVGRDTAGSGNAEELTVGGGIEFTGSGGIQRSALTGDVTASAGSGSTTIANNAVTFAKMQDVSATQRLIGRNTAGSGDPEEVTQSQALDWIGSTRGSVLYRGASGWAILTPGTSGQVLTSNGTGADPSYQDAGGGGGGMSATERQNFALSFIYQSKSLGDIRRGVNLFATGFKASTDTLRGISAGSSSNYDVTNASASGYVSPSVTGTTVQINANSTAVPQGNFTYFQRDVAVANSVTVYSIGLYSTSANTYTLKLGKRNSAGNYDIVVSQSFSHPGGGWADATLSSPYAVPGTGTYYVGAYGNFTTDATTSAATRAFIAGNQGVQTGLAGWTEDTNVSYPLRYTHTFSINNMTIVTTAQTTDASVSNGRVLVEYDNTATPTLDTDLTAEVTCNGGTNWASAALTAVTSNSQGGRKVAETSDTACTSGTSFAARVKTLNNKNVPLYGASVTVH